MTVTRFHGIKTDTRSAYEDARNFSTTSKQNGPLLPANSSNTPIVIISGAGGKTAHAPIGQCLGRGYKVIGLTSEPKKKSSHPNLTYVQVDRNKMTDPDYLKSVMKTALNDVKNCSEIVGMNLIGGSVASKGSSLRVLNEEIPVAFFKGVVAIGKEYAGKTSLIQISSIAATINGDSDCEYALIKDKADKEILSLSVKYGGNILVLRPGIILPNPTTDGRVNMGHDYSPDQFAYMRFIPLVGSGNQIQQPVSEDCLYEAALNGIKRDGTMQIVVAVGKDTLTQKELVGHFAKNAFGYIHIPVQFAEVLAKHFPRGRLAPYSVQMFARLDRDPVANQPLNGQEFEKLLGREAKGFIEIYGDKKELVGRPAPIVKHAGEVFYRCIVEPRKMMIVVKELRKSMGEWSYSSVAVGQEKK